MSGAVNFFCLTNLVLPPDRADTEVDTEGEAGVPAPSPSTTIVVTLAAPIEKLNKQIHSQPLISETVKSAAGGNGHLEAQSRGKVLVKGREASIQIYQVT